MAKTLEIRRHTDNDGDALTADGVKAALDIGRNGLTGDYALAVSSGAQRATQTIGCMLAGFGKTVARGVIVDEGFRSDREDEWKAAYKEVESGHLDDLKEADADLVAQDSAVLASALQRILDLLDEGETALVVGHSPTSEAAVLGLTGVTVDPLGKGEAVRVTANGDYSVER